MRMPNGTGRMRRGGYVGSRDLDPAAGRDVTAGYEEEENEDRCPAMICGSPPPTSSSWPAKQAGGRGDPGRPPTRSRERTPRCSSTHGSIASATAGAVEAVRPRGATRATKMAAISEDLGDNSPTRRSATTRSTTAMSGALDQQMRTGRPMTTPQSARPGATHTMTWSGSRSPSTACWSSPTSSS